MKPVARIRSLRQTPVPAAWLSLPLCAACLAFSSRAEDAPAEKAKADAFAALIARLDDEAFAVREDAETALLAGGQAALDAVRTAAARKDLSPDRRMHLATLAARLEAVLPWERITKPRRADFVTGKVKVKDALLAFEKVFGMAPGSFAEVAEREVDVKLAGATWAGALSEIARQADATVRPGAMDWPDRLRLIRSSNYNRGPVGVTAFSAEKGALLQGVCVAHKVYNAHASDPAKLSETKEVHVCIQAFAEDFFVRNFGRSADALVLVGASGREYPLAVGDCSYFAMENRIVLSEELVRALGDNHFHLKGMLAWDWPAELHRHTFVPQDQPEEATLGGNRRISVAFEMVAGKFRVSVKERVEANMKGPALTEGWFIPRDKEGHRIALEIAEHSGGIGTDGNMHYSEFEDTWILKERPAEIVYEYPVGFEKRELAFHLKGLTVPKPKEPEKP